MSGARAADASHELKSPLTSIKALAESLLYGQEVDIYLYQEYLHDINIEADRLARIVDSMLQLSGWKNRTMSLLKR